MALCAEEEFIRPVAAFADRALDRCRDRLPAFYPNNTYFDPKIVIRRKEN